MKLFFKLNLKIVIYLVAIFVSVFLAVVNYPPIIALWEESVVYTTFYPIQYPLPILAINISGDTVGGHDFIRYAFLTISRYLSDIFGCSIYFIRLPSIIYGLICLLLLYIVVKRWYGWRVGLLSAILLATNQTFFTFQHLLLIQTLTLAAILFAVERCQSLAHKKSYLVAMTFGFSCSILAINNIVGRYCLLFLFFFYLFDFEGYLFNSKRLIKWERIKYALVSFVSMVILLVLYYPPNFFRLFNVHFLFPMVGENITTGNTTFIETLFHNIKYFFIFYIIGDNGHASGLLSAGVTYPICNIFVFIFALIGLLLLFINIKKNKFLNVFFLFILLFLLIMMSQVHLNRPIERSSTLANPTRGYFLIPFFVFFASYGIISIYSSIKVINKKYSDLFIVIISCIFLVRIIILFNEINRFNNYVHNYKFDFSKKAIKKEMNAGEWNIEGTRETKNGDLIWDQNPVYLNLNQIYYYQLAKFISEKIDKKQKFHSNTMKILSIPSDFYTPDYIQYRGSAPMVDSLYYFPMFLSFYLADFGIDISYLINKNDVSNSKSQKYLTNILNFLGLYNLHKLSSNYSLYSPTNKKNNYILLTNRKQVKMFSKIPNTSLALTLPLKNYN